MSADDPVRDRLRAALGRSSVSTAWRSGACRPRTSRRRRCSFRRDRRRRCTEVASSWPCVTRSEESRTRTSRRRSRASTPTIAGVISRIQRQCPRGHFCGPCRSHGRQARPDIPATAEFVANGPNPNSGTVGPKTATVGVFIADARCSGSESFVTSSAERRINSADASSDRRPVASMARPRGRRKDLIGQLRSESAPTMTTRYSLTSARASSA